MIPAGKTIYVHQSETYTIRPQVPYTSLAGGLKYALTIEGYISHS